MHIAKTPIYRVICPLPLSCTKLCDHRLTSADGSDRGRTIVILTDLFYFMGIMAITFSNKKHLKNVRPIRHNEPPHAHSADVASGTVARRLRIDVHDIDNDDNDNDNA